MKKLLSLVAFLPMFLSTSVVSDAQNGQQKTDASYSLELRYSATTVKSGNPIVIDLITTNPTSEKLQYNRSRNAIRDYKLIVKDQNGQIVPQLQKRPADSGTHTDAHEVGSFILGALEPGEVLHETLEITRYFDLKTPGTYSIQLVRGKIKSNTLSITIAE
jgi:hypothetical protein